jgi:transcriptional regulator with XRE-family HTH domain
MDRSEKALRQFGRRLTELREQKELTIRDLARRSGLDARQISRIETGKVNLLFSTILALARGLGVSPEELLESL